MRSRTTAVEDWADKVGRVDTDAIEPYANGKLHEYTPRRPYEGPVKYAYSRTREGIRKAKEWPKKELPKTRLNIHIGSTPLLTKPASARLETLPDGRQRTVRVPPEVGLFRKVADSPPVRIAKKGLDLGTRILFLREILILGSIMELYIEFLFKGVYGSLIKGGSSSLARKLTVDTRNRIRYGKSATAKQIKAMEEIEGDFHPSKRAIRHGKMPAIAYGVSARDLKAREARHASTRQDPSNNQQNAIDDEFPESERPQNHMPLIETGREPEGGAPPSAGEVEARERNFAGAGKDTPTGPSSAERREAAQEEWKRKNKKRERGIGL